MELTTVTWNIGGGNVLKAGEDPTLLASYSEAGLASVMNVLQKINPDIITLQEVEGTTQGNQAAEIAQSLDYEYHQYAPTSDSHVNAGHLLGNAIISKHPIKDAKSGLFYNPNVKFDLEGKTVTSHDKGFVSGLVNVNGQNIRTVSFHLLPFRRMGIELESPAAHSIFESVADNLSFDDELMLVQGDCNIDDQIVGKYLVKLFNKYNLSEITLDLATTPKNRKYDHVLFKGMLLNSVAVDSTVATDHYPVTSIVKLPEIDKKQ